MLSAAGYVVSTFESAEAFLSSSHVSPPDCALLDIHLPNISGIELRDHMQRYQPDTAVVFVTGDLADAEAERRRRISQVLMKPVAAETLVAAIEAARIERSRR
jgi:FixJ family two-component response regulator